MIEETGGPAFPCEVLGKTEFIGSGLWARAYQRKERFQGMTLRDYFAAKAMQGLLAQSNGTAIGSDPALGAQYAYTVADAMIAARNAK